MRAVAGLFRWLAMAPLEVAVWCLEGILRPRPLAAIFFVLLVWPGAFHCLRPPLSHDVSGFELPLFGEPTRIYSEPKNLLADAPWRWVSPGMLLATLAAICTIMVLIRVKWFAIAAGVMLAGWLVCSASIAINQPLIVEQMDQELQLHAAIAVLLPGTAEPEVDVLTVPRFDRRALHGGHGSCYRALGYFPTGWWTFMAMAFLGVVWGARGPLLKRLGFSLVWILVGLLAAGLVCGRRLSAELWWQRAIVAEANGNLSRAEQMFERSLQIVPALENLERTWSLRGLIDFQRGDSTPAAMYFVGAKWAQNDRRSEAVAEFEALARSARLEANLHRWLAGAFTDLALRRYQQGNVSAAEQLFSLAIETDSSLPHRQLAVGVLLSRRTVREPEEIAVLIEPLLPHLADRAMRASLLALLGDSYFEAGQFAEARHLYQRSLAAYSLPKIINYRALRGLVGI